MIKTEDQFKAALEAELLTLTDKAEKRGYDKGFNVGVWYGGVACTILVFLLCYLLMGGS